MGALDQIDLFFHCYVAFYHGLDKPFLLVGSRKGKNGAAEIYGSVLPCRKGRIHIRELHELTFSVEVFFFVFVSVYEYLLCSIKDQGIL